MIIKALLLILEVLSSFLLITVILLQKSKGGGLGGSAFGGGGSDSVFGARAGNVLTKITIGLSVFFLGNTLLLAFLYAGEQSNSLMKGSAGGAVNIMAEAPVDGAEAPPIGVPPIDSGLPIEAGVPDAADEATAAPAVLEQPVTVPAEITEDPGDL
jgi:preprotein translocase subunit SecG